MLVALLLGASSVGVAQAQFTARTTTWTHTYLKAKPGLRSELKDFVLQNWIAQDAKAVEQGLFKTYQLLENGSADTTYDFIVAVAYFDTTAYAGVAVAFEVIRKAHRKVLIGGKDFRDLGLVVRSQRLYEVAGHLWKQD